jgi:hypothetical protein
MLAVTRRALVVAALAFWMGGFTFYAVVVVPVGQEVLGSHRRQGFVTRQVTNYLNWAGTVALVILAWDLVAGKCRTWLWRTRWAAWAGMALTLGVLFWLHAQLDDLLDQDSFRILDGAAFYTAHRWYLIISAIQWSCALAFGVLALVAWRLEDRDTRLVRDGHDV